MKSNLSNRIMKGMNSNPERFLTKYDKDSKSKEKSEESNSDKGSNPKQFTKQRNV